MKTVSQLYILDEYATLRQAALLRVLCLSLIQEVYNHWKISHLWFLLLARAAQRKDASSLDEHLAQPSGKRVSSTISRATKHKKKEKVPFPWVEDLKPNLEKSVNVVKSDAEWRKTLTPEEFRVTREQRVFSHRYYKEKRAGMYNCICCGAPLLDSGTGWPSFYAPAVGGAVSEHEDRSLFMRRTEARFAKCESHLGHVFSDGPNPTGTLYCINGAALKHDADKKSGNSSR